MEIQDDFKELLALLHSKQVEFVIVGAYALAAHGVPRYTGDLDLLVRPTPENANRILAALEEFGFGDLDLDAGDFCAEGRVIQLGRPPVRVDILTSLTAVSWEAVAAGALEGTYGDVPVRYIGKEEFIANKRATGRTRDLADAEELEQHQGG